MPRKDLRSPPGSPLADFEALLKQERKAKAELKTAGAQQAGPETHPEPLSKGLRRSLSILSGSLS